VQPRAASCSLFSNSLPVIGFTPLLAAFLYGHASLAAVSKALLPVVTVVIRPEQRGTEAHRFTGKA